MVASRKTKKVFCTVVRVPVSEETPHGRFANRPSDLLPWADPYIARLVQKLQNEVRLERMQARSAVRSHNPLKNDLDPPSPCTESEWEWTEDTRWTRSDEPSSDWAE